MRHILQLMGPFNHYRYAQSAFGTETADELMEQFVQIVKDSKLSDGFYLVNIDGDLYLTTDGTQPSEVMLKRYFDETGASYEVVRSRFSGIVPYITYKIREVIDRKLQYDLVGTLISERKHQGISVKYLSQLTDLPVNVIEDIEARNIVPDLHTTHVIANALGKQLKIVPR